MMCELFWMLDIGGRHAVAQLVEELRYKPEGRGFDGVIEIFHWRNSSLSGVDSASNRNEHQEYFPGGGVKAAGQTTLPPSCADCLAIW